MSCGFHYQFHQAISIGRVFGIWREAVRNGAPIEMIYEGQQLKLCCKSCVLKLKKDPAKYLLRLK